MSRRDRLAVAREITDLQALKEQLALASARNASKNLIFAQEFADKHAATVRTTMEDWRKGLDLKLDPQMQHYWVAQARRLREQADQAKNEVDSLRGAASETLSLWQTASLLLSHTNAMSKQVARDLARKQDDLVQDENADRFLTEVISK